MKTIVLAWTVEDFRVVGESRRDLGERPKLEAFQSPKAAVWLNDGTLDDLKKAQTYASGETDYQISVFAYDDEADPIAKAKRDVMPIGRQDRGLREVAPQEGKDVKV